jgi:cytoskeletal protein RodZ
VAGVLAVLLLIGAVRRAISKSQSNKAMDHLDGGLYRDYSATPKRGKRNEIRSGMDEEKPQEEPETTPEEAEAPAAAEPDIPDETAPMAETLRRLYSEKKEDAEQAAETVKEAAADVAEAVEEAAEDAGEALKDAADTAVQTAEAAHRRRAKKS